MVVIGGKFKVKPEFKDELIAMSNALIAPSLEEVGCISYGFYEDKTNPGQFLFFEEWKSREDIAQHFETSYFNDFAARFPDMIEGEASIKIYHVSEVETV